MDTTIDMQARMDDFIAGCKKAGLKVTHQRVEIFKTLAATTEHPDVDTIYDDVRKRIPSISLDTVYRTLRTLVKHKLVRLLQVTPERMRFDANTEPHYHFVCSETGKVIDLDLDPIDIEIPQALRDMANVESIDIEFHGTLRK